MHSIYHVLQAHYRKKRIGGSNCNLISNGSLRSYSVYGSVSEYISYISEYVTVHLIWTLIHCRHIPAETISSAWRNKLISGRSREPQWSIKRASKGPYLGKITNACWRWFFLRLFLSPFIAMKNITERWMEPPIYKAPSHQKATPVSHWYSWPVLWKSIK